MTASHATAQTDNGPTPEGGRFSVVGKTVNRKEDRRLVTGRGRYVSDLQLPGTRHVHFVRADIAHARITGIDTAEAETHAGVEAVYTAESVAFAGRALRAQSALPSYVETEQPILASGKIRFLGEAVATVVATDRYVAEDAAELVAIDYEPLEVTVRPWDRPTSSPVHDEAADNVLLDRRFEAGDVSAAMADAAVIVRRELTTNRHGGNPMEARAGVALFDGVDRLTFYSGTQIPHLVRNMLAEILELPEGNIRVVAPDVGGGFGVKAVLYPEDVAVCLLALAQPGTPIKWVEDRYEHLVSSTHARDHRYQLEAGFASDGALLAIRAEIDCNVGAYSVYPWTAGIEPLMAGGLFAGPYRLDNYDCLVRGVATNTCPSGPYRGVARPVTVFAMEALLDSGARALGLDGPTIRRRNLIGPNDVPYRMPTRLIDDTGHYEVCLDRALAAIDYNAALVEQARRREAGENPIGVGIAVYNELTGLGRAASAGPRMPFRTGHEACTVRMNPDGSVTVFSGATSQGQGLETTLAQVVADELGVSYDLVDVRVGDTDASLWGFGAFSSRQSVIAGGAAQKAAEGVREKVVALAVELLEANPDDLRLAGGRAEVSGSPDRSFALSELARIAYLESNRLPEGIEPGLEATRFYDPIMGAFAAGAQAAVIEFEPRTGELRILDWACVEDAGRILNPQIVHGQIAGSLAQGIGGAIYEHLVYDDDGNLLTSTLLDYLMPTSAEIPDFAIDHIAEPADNPLGVRGVGEGGTLGPNAVLAGAVLDALGVEIDDLPVSPARIWTELRSSGLSP